MNTQTPVESLVTMDPYCTCAARLYRKVSGSDESSRVGKAICWGQVGARRPGRWAAPRAGTSARVFRTGSCLSTSATRSCSPTTAPTDNWQGEYAVLLANGGGPKLAGIIVNTSGPWPDLDTNMAGWRGLVAAATASGLRNIPDPQSSTGPPLTRPASGQIEDTDREPVGGRAHDRRPVREPEPPLPAAGRRDGRPADGCGGRLPHGPDGHRTGRRGFVPGDHDQQRRRDGPAQRRDGSLGRRHRHGAFSLRAGQRLLRPDHRRPDLATCGASRQRVRRLDRSQAAEHLRSRPGRRSGRRRGGGHSGLRHRCGGSLDGQGSSAPARPPVPISSTTQRGRSCWPPRARAAPRPSASGRSSSTRRPTRPEVDRAGSGATSLHNETRPDSNRWRQTDRVAPRGAPARGALGA